jgi:hypothetical protein
VPALGDAPPRLKRQRNTLAESEYAGASAGDAPKCAAAAAARMLMLLSAAARAAARARAPRARSLAGAARAAAPPPAPPRARGLASAPPRAPLVFFVQRAGGAAFTSVEVPAGAYVDALVGAAIAKLRLDAPPDSVTLSLAAGGAGAPPLDATLALDAALAAGALAPHAKLLVTVRPTPPPQSAPDLALFSNVISRGPDAAFDARLVALARDESAPACEGIRALGALAADAVRREPGALGASDSLPLFATEAHATLLGALTGHARALADGHFVGVNGAPCRTLVGARGIGKTAVMRAFCAVAPSAFPSLVVLYVTGEGLDDLRNSFHAADLRALVTSAALARGVDALRHVGPFALETALAKAQMRVLLIVDEFDELYRVDADGGAARRNIKASLGLLGTLGGSTVGNYGVLLCGSSASTHALVRGDPRHLGDRFPLARAGIPDLNSQKFARLAVPSAVCSRSDEVELMLTALAGRAALPADVRPLARLLTFFVGATPRAVSATTRGSALATVSQGVAFAAAAAAPLGTLHREAALLWDALLARLVAANGRLRALVGTSDGSVSLDSLIDPKCDWEGAVKSLDWPTVAAAWAACAQENELPHARDGAFLAHLVSILTDNHRLHVVDDSAFGVGGLRVFPMSAAQLVAAGDEALLERALSALRPLGKLAGSAAKAVALARALGV